MMIILFFIFGSSLASFLTLVVERYLKQSILYPPSHCDSCQTRLKWYQLIPILSQLIFNFSCPTCKKQISKHYFILEVIIGSLWMLPIFFDSNLSIIIFITLSIFLAYFDLKYQAFPLWYGILMLGIAILFRPLHSLFFILILITILSGLINLRIGCGDFLYLSILSLFVNFTTLLWITQIACFLGIGYFSIKKEQKLIPFVPFLLTSYCSVLIIHYFFK